MFDTHRLAAAIAAHGAVTRIVVVDHRGSTPRETGTEMLVWQDGQAGTIGGGALEYEAVAAARQTADNAELSIPLGPALGQCCGGAVTLVLERYERAPEAGAPVARRLKGDADMPLSIARALAAYRNAGQQPGTLWQDGWLLEATAEARTPLWIYGAGHVGRALVEVFDGLPVAITWVDTGPERFPTDIPQSVTALPAADPCTAARLAPDDAHHLILTYSHKLDLELCHALLSRRTGSIGLIGSATKWARFRSRLHDLGCDAATLARITCPIGDPALGKHPKAIALGVATRFMQSALRGNAAKDTA